jgi:hypothetical protein
MTMALVTIADFSLDDLLDTQLSVVNGQYKVTLYIVVCSM